MGLVQQLQQVDRSQLLHITFTIITIGRIVDMDRGAAVEAGRKSGVEVKIHRIKNLEIEKIEPWNTSKICEQV